MRKNFGVKNWLYPMPVFIVGSYDEAGIPNAMNAAWGGIYDTNLVMVCLADDHKTTENIRKNKAFTISFATAEQTVACDYVGIVSGNDLPDKLERCGLHAEKSEFVNAPLFSELPISVECKLLKFNEDGICIGEILNVCCDEAFLGENGKPDIKKINPIIYDSVNHGYWSFGQQVGRAFDDGKQIK
jgi:flavin reductase (DIM6/NTAB) family NADH-FMN oxidoreductase RutF